MKEKVKIESFEGKEKVEPEVKIKREGNVMIETKFYWWFSHFINLNKCSMRKIMDTKREHHNPKDILKQIFKIKLFFFHKTNPSCVLPTCKSHPFFVCFQTILLFNLGSANDFKIIDQYHPIKIWMCFLLDAILAKRDSTNQQI